MIFSSLILMPLDEALKVYAGEGLPKPSVLETKSPRRPHGEGTLRVIRADEKSIVVSRFLDDNLYRLEKPEN